MKTGTDMSSALRTLSNWLPNLAQSQGFLPDALDANRAGRYTDAQVRMIKLRGWSLLRKGISPALGALGISLIGFLFTLFAASSPFPQRQVPGVVIGPGREILFMVPLISLTFLVIGSFVLRSAWRSWQTLRTDLQRNNIAFVEGPVTLKFLQDPLLAVQGVNFVVDQRAFLAFRGPWAGTTASRFRIYYVPRYNWMVNVEPLG
jgi:hypothetical protein